LLCFCLLGRRPGEVLRFTSTVASFLPPTAPPLLIITGSGEGRRALKLPVPRRCPSMSSPTNKQQAGAREPFAREN
jgi:hypothetical protein